MKQTQILATSWLIGFPITGLFLVSQFVFPPDLGNQTSNLTANLLAAKNPGQVSKTNMNALELEEKRANLIYQVSHSSDSAEYETWPPIEEGSGENPSAAAKPAIAPPPNCSDIPGKMEEITAQATRSAPEVHIDCNLILGVKDTVTKKMIFEGAAASGVTLDCQGATLNAGKGRIIEIRSRKFQDPATGEWKWERPEDITIKSCNMIGAVRVWGMAQSGEGNEATNNEVNHLLESSRKAGHTSRVRSNAPKNIIFDNVIISSKDRIPLYLSPGVSYFQLLNSELKGSSTSVTVYLDAETYRNTFKYNKIYTTTTREVMALDGSSYNKIINNWFSSLSKGGIFLYRNCGEGGVSRHATPRRNQIINNIFYYNVYQGFNPSVYLGSRNGNRNYCDADNDSEYGSGISNLDFAQYNVVMQNQIYKRSITDMIRVRNKSVNSPNYIAYNQTVTTAVDRRAGCYVTGGYEKDFIVDGESIDLFKNSRGEPVCWGYKYTCNDGELTWSLHSACTVTKVDFDCQVSGNSDGCSTRVSGPLGQRIIGAKGACNLESGMVTSRQLAAVPANRLQVVRASDRNRIRSNCFIGPTNLAVGEKTITGINGRRRVLVGCKEHDVNGGDCHIKGIVYYH